MMNLIGAMLTLPTRAPPPSPRQGPHNLGKGRRWQPKTLKKSAVGMMTTVPRRCNSILVIGSARIAGTSIRSSLAELAGAAATLDHLKKNMIVTTIRMARAKAVVPTSKETRKEERERKGSGTTMIMNIGWASAAGGTTVAQTGRTTKTGTGHEGAKVTALTAPA